MGYSTIRRIEANDVQPMAHTAMKIVRVTRETAEQVHNWALEHMPEYASHSESSADLNVVYRPFGKSSFTHAGVFRELNFGTCEESDLVGKFGQSTTSAIEDFVAAKIVKKSGSSIQLVDENIYINNNPSFVRELSKQNVDNFDPNLPGNVGFVEYLETDDEGANAFYYLMMEFEERLDKLRKDHKRSGHRKVGISGMMTMFDGGKK